jgi:hypothetical protein
MLAHMLNHWQREHSRRGDLFRDIVRQATEEGDQRLSAGGKLVIKQAAADWRPSPISAAADAPTP